MILLLTGCWLLLIPRGDRADDIAPPGWDSEDAPDSWDSNWVDPTLMRPDYVEFAQSWGFDGSEPVAYSSLDGTPLPNSVLVKFYDARFWSDLEPWFVCEEPFELVPQGLGDFWGTWSFEMRRVEGSSNPCHFEGGPLEGEVVDFGIGHPHPELEQEMAFSFGADYGAWAPYLYAMRVGHRRIGWAVLLELDEDLQMVTGDNCPALGAACVEAQDVDVLRGPAVVWGGSLYVIETTDLLGN